jgi:hypothetical protein
LAGFAWITSELFSIFRSVLGRVGLLRTESNVEFGRMGKHGFHDDLKIWNAEPVKSAPSGTHSKTPSRALSLPQGKLQDLSLPKIACLKTH